jgi:hypothetical protein
MAAKSFFRFLELSARITLIALFSAVHGGWIFLIFFAHAALILAALRFWPGVVGGGVPDRRVWEKFVAAEKIVVHEKHSWWPEKLFKGRVIYVPTLDDSKLSVASLIWPPSMFIANATDHKGRFWWRSKTCPRRSFLSVDRNDAIFPLPAYATLQVFEACLMFLLVGVVVRDMPHYHTYFTCAALVNFAWLLSIVAWISSAALWNPFLPEGPPLAFAKGAPGSGAPGTADAGARSQGSRGDGTAAKTVSKWSGWHGADAACDDDDDETDPRMPFFNREGKATCAGANVAASMAAPGVFSPGGRTPGGRSARRPSNGVAASYAVGATSMNSEKPAARALFAAADEPRKDEVSAEEAAARETAARETAARKTAAREAAAREAAARETAARETAAREAAERKAQKAEAARLEIARLDALRREEVKNAMRREKELKLLELKKKKEEKTSKPAASACARPPVNRPSAVPFAAVIESNPSEEPGTSDARRRESGGLFGRPGIVVTASVSSSQRE